MTHSRIDFEDVIWWLSFNIHPRRIADYYGISHVYLITKARRDGLFELADQIRTRMLDDGEALPFVLPQPASKTAKARRKKAA